MSRGKFITFEGGEGCGKSTQARRLVDALRASGRTVLAVREPGGTRLAELVRTLVREETADPPVPAAETLLFLAARAQLVATAIRPALDRGEWVVCDRFSDSTFAYQGFGRGFPLDLLRRLNAFATVDLAPDLTFLLDVPRDVALARLAARQAATATSADRIESAGEDFHSRLRDGFLALAKAEPARFRIIDASAQPDSIAARIFTEVSSLL